MYLKFLLLLLILFLGSSCTKDMDFSDYHIGDWLVIKKGSRLIQGNNYEVIWKTQNLNSNKYYMEVIYYFDREGSFRDTIIKLEKVDSIHFRGKLSIPKKTSWVHISLSTPFTNLSCPYSVRLPVYIDSRKPEYGANSIALLNSTKEEYIKFFYDERRLYPENYSIFIVRWAFEEQNNIIKKDSIMKQLKEIALLNNSPEIDIIKLVGNSIIMNYSEHGEMLKNLAMKLKFSPIMNNWEVSGLFVKMLIRNFERDSASISKILENIIKYNPYSHSVHSLITSGTLVDDPKKVRPSLAISTINRWLQKDSSYEILLNKASLLCTKFLPDSIVPLKFLIQKLTKDYLRYFSDEDAYYNLQDNFHSLYNGIGLITEPIKRYAIFSNDYETSINLLKELVEKIDKNLISKGLFYLSIGELYERKNENDSAIKYYFVSNLFLKNVFDLPYQNLTKLLENKYGGKNIAFYLKNLNKRFSLPQTRISFNDLLIEYSDGTKEVISDVHQPKLFIFFSTECSGCEKVFNTLAKVKSIIENKKIKIFLISLENADKLKGLWIYSYFNAKVITNPRSLQNLFNLDNAVPKVLIVNSKNYIVNLIDGYPGEGINWNRIFASLD
ncbi:MAG: hypothetical protein CH6_1833 [Candidatus Kapaibacterium sp.]|nr:MAG: hypothetical protein CH6_1833 [Candidatus Kapabacteria bacterium]